MRLPNGEEVRFPVNEKPTSSTVTQTEAGIKPTADEEALALAAAKRDAAGNPVDWRTGEPLVGNPEFRWDPDNQRWVAENPRTADVPEPAPQPDTTGDTKPHPGVSDPEAVPSGLTFFSRGGPRTNLDVIEHGGSLPLTRETIDDAARMAGIDLEGVDVQIALTPDDVTFLDSNGAIACADSVGILLGPASFTDMETLIRTLAHERTHVYQNQFKDVAAGGNLMELEDEAYASEQAFVDAWKAGGGE